MKPNGQAALEQRAERRALVLDFLRENGPSTVVTVAVETDLGEGATRDALKELLDEEQVAADYRTGTGGRAKIWQALV